MTSDTKYTSNLDYHLRQYKAPYRSTVSLIDFLKRNVDVKKIKRVLDMGCGGGANIHWLKQSFPEWEFTGIDFDPQAIDVAKKQNSHSTFFCEDILNLKHISASEPFDLVLSIQVILTAPFSLYEFLEIAAPLAQKNIIITSLFSNEYFEQDTIRRDLKKQTSYIYKIDSLKRLEDYLKDKSFDLNAEEIKIDQDLPKPEPLTLSTYTVRLENGDRMQISPYMLMPWYALNLTRRV